MRPGRGARVLGIALAGAMVTTLVGPIASARATEADARIAQQRAIDALEAKLGADLTAGLHPVGGLHTIIVPVDDVRAGGIGSFEVHVAQRATPGISADDVAVTITTPAAVSLQSAKGDGWTCDVTPSEATCALAQPVSDTKFPDAIVVDVNGAPDLRSGTAKVTAKVTWSQRSDAAYTAAGVPWPNELGAGSKVVRDNETSTARIDTNSALDIRARYVGPTRHLVDPDGETAILETYVAGVEGTAVKLSWRQLCLTQDEAAAVAACDGAVQPKAEFDSGREDARADKWTSTAVHIPAVARTTPFVFEVTAIEGGVTATDRVTVIAEPVVANRMDPRLDTLTDLAQFGSAPVVGTTHGPATHTAVAQVNGAGSTTVVAGERLNLVVTAPGHRVASVRWSADGAFATVVSRGVARGRQLRLSVPRDLSGNVVVHARATLDDGTIVNSDEIIHVDRLAQAPRATTRAKSLAVADTPSPSASPSVSPTPSPSDSPTPTPSASPTSSPTASPTSSPSGSPSGSTAPFDFCTLANGIVAGTASPITLPGGGTLTFANASLDSSTCSATSTVTFSGTTLQLGEHALSIAGNLTASGLAITSGSYQPPDEWSSLDSLIQQETAFTVPTGTSAGASLGSDGTWGSLTGILDLPVVAVMSLPSPWAWQPAHLSLSSGSLSLHASATGAGNAAIVADVTLGFDASINGQVTAQNIGLFPDAAGNTVTATGTGTVNWSKTDGTSTVTFSINAAVTAPVVVLNNLTLTTLTVAWKSGDGLTLASNAQIGSAATGLALTANGSFTDAADWSMSMTQTGSWTVGDGVVLSGLTGSLSRTKGVTAFTLSGNASGWNPSQYLTGTTLAASITNACPAPATRDSSATCDVGTVRLSLAITSTLTLPSVASSVPFTATAQVDLQTWEFTIVGGVNAPAGSIGPAALNLRNITITLTDTDAGTNCALPAQPKLKAAQSLSLGLTAQGTVLGSTVTLVGSFGTGLCLIGQFEGGTPSQIPYAQNLTNVVVAYSSTAVTITTASGQSLAIPAQGLGLAATMTLPSAVTQIGLSGTGSLTAIIGTSPFTFDATIEANVGSGVKMFSANDGSALVMTDVDFSLQSKGGTVSLSASVDMNYTTVAGPSTIASSTPLVGTVAFQVGSSGVNVVLSASVDTARVPSGVVMNAFGTAGLQVRELSLSVKFGTDISLGFAANVTLPDAWGQQVGLLSGSVVVLDANISEESPCLNFQIGRPQGDTGFAVNLANAGTVWARSLGLYVAPTGCTVGSVTLAPGFGMSFDGMVAQQFPLTVSAQVTLPGAGSSGFAIKASLVVGAFSVGSVQFEQTTATLDIDTSAGRYAVSFSGGVTLFKSTAQLSFSFSAQGSTVSASANANVDLELPGISVQAALTFNVTVVSGTIQTLQFDAQLNFNLLGIIPIKIQASLDYENGVIKHVHAGIYFGYLTLVVWTGRQGWVAADYTSNGNAWHFTLGWSGQSLQWYYHHWYDWGWAWGPSNFNWIDVSGAIRSLVRGEAPIATTNLDETAVVPVDSLTFTENGKSFRVTSMRYGIRTVTTASVDVMPTVEFEPVMTLTVCSEAKHSTCGQKRSVTVDFTHRRLIVHPTARQVSTDVMNPTVQPGDVVLSGKAWLAASRLADQAADEYRTAHPDARQQLLPLKEWPRFYAAYEKALAERQAATAG